VTETVIVDRPHAGVVVLQLNRPKQLNAINEQMRDELIEELAAIGVDASVNGPCVGAGFALCHAHGPPRSWGLGNAKVPDTLENWGSMRLLAE
jgi:enoyl-CoA hydratase/carnithine racemase